MKMTYFWEWIESTEFYDKIYRNDIDRYSSNNPKVFSHWFPQGQNRLYIPFQIDGNKPIEIMPDVNLLDYRNKLETILNNNGYTLENFRKGLVSSKNNNKRKQRIVPVLNQLTKEKDLIRIYERAQIRLNPGINHFSICISQDPHDIARMSYDKRWQKVSCMRLEDDKGKGGEKFKQVYDEVKDGGLIAYLIEPEDKNIEKPYARILLRRFSNDTTNVALCEETVYGLAIPEFKETVKNWLDQHNPIAFGKFTRKGSEWSDTFSMQKIIKPNHSQLTAKNQPQLWDMLNKLEPEQFTQEAASIIASRKQLEPEFVTKVIELVNKQFKNNKEEITKVATRRIYTFYIPRAAMELNIPVNNIEDIIKAYPLQDIARNISTDHKDSNDVTKYLMPILTQMTKDVYEYNTKELAECIEQNKELQSKEFINSIPKETLQEILYYISNENVKFIIRRKIYTP